MPSNALSVYRYFRNCERHDGDKGGISKAKCPHEAAGGDSKAAVATLLDSAWTWQDQRIIFGIIFTHLLINNALNRFNLKMDPEYHSEECCQAQDLDLNSYLSLQSQKWVALLMGHSVALTLIQK